MEDFPFKITLGHHASSCSRHCFGSHRQERQECVDNKFINADIVLLFILQTTSLRMGRTVKGARGDNGKSKGGEETEPLILDTASEEEG